MSEIAVKERVSDSLPSGDMMPTGELASAKLTSNEQLIAEERDLQSVESKVESGYHGVSGYLRLFQISRVIAMLSLYLYLDQLDLHQKHQNKVKNERLRRARCRRRPYPKRRSSP